MASWKELAERGKALKRELAAIMEDASSESRRSSRRESAVAFESNDCSVVFQHPSLLKTSGVSVADSVNASHVLRSVDAFCVEVLNDAKKTRGFAATAAPVRYTKMTVMRRRKTTGGFVRRAAFKVFGSRPYTDGHTAPHALVPSGESQTATRLGLSEALTKLRSGTVDVVPLYLATNFTDIGDWEELPAKLHESTELMPQVYGTIPALNRVLRDGDGAEALDFPPYGIDSWVVWQGKVMAMKSENSGHAMCLFFTRGDVAVLVDSNSERQKYVTQLIAAFVEELGFSLAVAPLPEMNRADARETTFVLQEVGVQTPVTIGGYCASLSFAYMVDVLCTGRHDADHFLRFLKDIVPRNASADVVGACIVLYARAVATDITRLCIDKIKRRNALPAGWPHHVPAQYPTTVRVRWSQGALRQV